MSAHGQTTLFQCETFAQLSKCLNLSEPLLAYTLYKVDRASQYQILDIPKKSGGIRKILSPSRELKHIQKCLAKSIAETLKSSQDLKKEDEGEDEQKLAPLSHGSKKGTSIKTNAAAHVRSRNILSFDLKDFFPSVHAGRIKGFLIADRRFQLGDRPAGVIANIATFNGTLPQGSPCSPIIADLVAEILDARLLSIAVKTGTKYTRYVDDITFSTSQKNLPERLCKIVEGKPELSEQLTSIVKRAGFEINSKKTRVSYYHSRQRVTGAVVNQYTNVPREFYTYTRAMAHSLFQRGSYHVGKKSYTWHDLSCVRGRLSHILHMRRPLGIEKEKLGPLFTQRAINDVWRSFLLYENFIQPVRPVFLFEGETDYSHFNHAKNALKVTTPPFLKGHSETKFRIKPLDEYKRNIVGLGLSASEIKTFANKLKKSEVNFAKRVGVPAPIIIIFDEDTAGRNCKKDLLSSFKNTRYLVDPGIHALLENIYLIELSLAGDDVTDIESLYPSHLLSFIFEGKSFNQSNKPCAAGEFSKRVFAEKVVPKHAVESDFYKFSALFAAIGKVFDHQASK